MGVVVVVIILVLLSCVVLKSSGCLSERGGKKDSSGNLSHKFQILKRRSFCYASGGYFCCKSGDIKTATAVTNNNHIGVARGKIFWKLPERLALKVNEELEKYSSGIRGVPHYSINGKHVLRGGQAPEVFLKAFQVAAGDGGI